MQGTWQIKWYDGMLLNEDTFIRAQNDVNELMAHFIRIYRPYYWGYSRLVLHDMQSTPLTSLIHTAHGVFPNGRLFIFDEAQDSVTINITPAVTTDLYLTYNSSQPIERKSRNSLQIKPNFILTNTPEKNKSLLLLKNITVENDCLISFDNTHIPPILSIGASQYLKNKLTHVLHALKDKRETISKSLYARICQLNNSHTEHPYEIYKLLQEIILISLPNLASPYDHNDLSQLVTTMHMIIDWSNAETCEYQELNLVRDGYYWYSENPINITQSHLILGFPVTANKPNSFKVAYLKHIERVISYALDGLPLQALNRPPESIRDDHLIFFTLDTYDIPPILESENDRIAIFMPTDNSQGAPRLWIK